MSKISDTTHLEKLFEKHYGKCPKKIEKLPPSGSNREYFYMCADNDECIGTIGSELKENEAFKSFSDSFFKASLPVPEILETSADGFLYLQSFIQGVSLFEYLEKHRTEDYSPDNQTLEYYKEVLKELPKFQTIGKKVIDFSKCYPRQKFDSRSVMWDLNYFKYYFLKASHTIFDEEKLQEDFQKITECLILCDSDFFMYRDFQSRNIIISNDGKPYFIDFQGGRLGALQYDVASLLYDGKAALNPQIRTVLLDFYLSELKKYVEVDTENFKKYFSLFALIRVLQAMGSYGYRGFLEKKEHFLLSIPPALNNLKYLLENSLFPVDFPHLRQVLFSMIENPTLKSDNFKPQTLTVSVKSFSYKRGLPYDSSGNGGGFVFDCRAIHNPGRYEKYKMLCGKYSQVIEFFKQEPEMEEFINLSQQMVAISVRKYLKRGFKNLSVNFGCTGGQHRSVYSAEKMAEFLKNNFPNLNVELKHLELEK